MADNTVLCKKYPLLGLLHTPQPPLHRPPAQCHPSPQKIVCKRRPINDFEDPPTVLENSKTPLTLCVPRTVEPWTVKTTSTITITTTTTSNGTTVTVVVHL
ncbi:E1-E4 [Pan paniscus papillomavirus 1]|nr:E1-E4 [Pan paniscus papillomavirus 1]